MAMDQIKGKALELVDDIEKLEKEVDCSWEDLRKAELTLLLTVTNQNDAAKNLAIIPDLLRDPTIRPFSVFHENPKLEYIACLQESKLQDIHISIWRSIGGARLNAFEFLPAQGTAGGIIIAWDTSQTVGSLIHKGTFSITVKFSNTDNNSSWACTTVYGPILRQLKIDFWQEIRTIRNLHPDPLDKNKGDINPRDLATPQNLLGELNLIDPPLQGRRFTWSNGQANPCWVRLDRFLFSHNWSLLYPRNLQVALPRFGSDHSPICLEFGNHHSQPRLFRFEKSWYTNEQLENLIQSWWSETNPEGYRAFILSKKLANLKVQLRIWAKETFRASNLHKTNLLIELNSLDSLQENRPLSHDESIRFAQTRSDLFSLLNQEEIYWKQRSRITWLKEGDSNTKFFHLMANGRRNKTFIPRILCNDHWVEGNHDIGKAFSEHFQRQFSTPITHRFLFDWQNLFIFKDRHDLSSLELPFNPEEIKQAVFDLNADKAPGPDGFPIFFFQKHWDLIQGNILKLCDDFCHGSINLERINWIHIALIAKTNAPSVVFDFRPISLINSACKIISKILATRLSLMIHNLVDVS
ncbi:RNA-directed DNA polymerase protein [Dioscorea alata]|uniref:RNA-directed DNA polymerase protein n=1 Tax=Dioscorea alata TaxID=55571 RepID=A0ACB7VQN9_DIOAL|nr:RNA-directed DNA polymerase protein [Dioscorea alata]